MRTTRRAIRVPALAILLAATAGCTFQAVRPELSVAPPQRFARLVVGDISAADKAWEALVPHVRQGVVQGLIDAKAFETVTDGAVASPSTDTLVLSGTITEVEKGSAALRLLVGMGAGQAKVKGVFELRDASDRALVRFEGRRSYLGGAGMGGAGFLDMDELAKRLGQTVAETVARWSRGKAID